MTAAALVVLHSGGDLRPFLDAGRIGLVPDSPVFSYAVHSTRADESVMARIWSGLRYAAAMATVGEPDTAISG